MGQLRTALALGAVLSWTPAWAQTGPPIPISQLPSAGAPTSADLFYVVQGGTSKNVTFSGLVAALSTIPVSTGPLTVTAPLIVNDVIGNTLPALYVIGAKHNIYTDATAVFTSNVDYGSFGDGNTTFGFVVISGKNVDASATTGSWQTASFRYTGFGGGTSSSFLTAGQELMAPVVSVNNNSGRFFGNNPECIIPTGMTPTECTGEEIDIETLSSPTSDRHGLRIVDLGSTGSHASDDTGLSILSSGIGWTNVMEFGGLGGNFPGIVGGNIITTVSSTAALNSGIYFQNLTGTPTLAWLALPANTRGICFGAGTCNGGAITSTTSANGGSLVFGSNNINLAFSATDIIFPNTGGVTNTVSTVPTVASGQAWIGVIRGASGAGFCTLEMVTATNTQIIEANVPGTGC